MYLSTKRLQQRNDGERRRAWWGIILILLLGLGLAACTGSSTDSAPDVSTVTPEPVEAEAEATHPPLDPTYAAQIAAQRDPNIPDLPFPDNPDPSQCGIPTQWGEDGEAWLNGRYEGEMVQETVLLYESHLRLQITTQAPHGTKVNVILYQQNPVTDYYFVKIEGAEQPNEGWVPGPFLSFEPIEPVDG